MQKLIKIFKEVKANEDKYFTKTTDRDGTTEYTYIPGSVPLKDIYALSFNELTFLLFNRSELPIQREADTCKDLQMRFVNWAVTKGYMSKEQARMYEADLKKKKRNEYCLFQSDAKKYSLFYDYDKEMDKHKKGKPSTPNNKDDKYKYYPAFMQCAVLTEYLYEEHPDELADLLMGNLLEDYVYLEFDKGSGDTRQGFFVDRDPEEVINKEVKLIPPRAKEILEFINTYWLYSNRDSINEW